MMRPKAGTTFYEHFTTKAECLVALYEMASLGVLDVLRKAIDARQHWDAAILGTLRVGAVAEQVKGEWIVSSAAMSRSARRLMTGEVWVPSEAA